MVNWKHQKVLVCGGAGMIGSHLARRLLKEGADVTIVDNLSSGSRKNIEDIKMDVDFVKQDLRNYDNCKLRSRGMDFVFQLAADMGGIGYITAIGAQIVHNSGLINLNMFEAGKNNDVPNYFYSSSACVYPEYLQQNVEVTPLKESDAYPAQPDQFYGWEKLFSEKVAEAYQRDYGMNIKMARFHNVFGPMFTAFDKEKGKAPCHLILKAIRHPKPPFSIWGDGLSTRSFLYIDDCVEAVLRLMGTEHLEPINIGSDRLVTVNELARVIIKISGKKIEPTYELDRPQGVRGRNADLTQVARVLNWRPEVSLEEGLELTYYWAMDNLKELEGV